MEKAVTKYHRTKENYFAGLQPAGFMLDSLREAQLQSDRFKDIEVTFQRHKRIHLCLIITAQKVVQVSCMTQPKLEKRGDNEI